MVDVDLGQMVFNEKSQANVKMFTLGVKGTDVSEVVPVGVERVLWCRKGNSCED